MNYQIFPISESALTVDFGNLISVELNEKILALNKFIRQQPFCGFIENVPAYSSLTVFYDLCKVQKFYPQFPTAYSAVENFIKNALDNLNDLPKPEARLIRIPVFYGKEFAPDLDFVAETNNLTPPEVIKIHTEKVYRVFMLGFLPAFAYMGEVDERIATPRKKTPRLKIEKGSVGIAGKQTGIYPLESPGGWQIIGKTTLEMFQPESAEISLLQTGDLVRFYEI